MSNRRAEDFFPNATPQEKIDHRGALAAHGPWFAAGLDSARSAGCRRSPRSKAASKREGDFSRPRELRLHDPVLIDDSRRGRSAQRRLVRRVHSFFEHSGGSIREFGLVKFVSVVMLDEFMARVIQMSDSMIVA